MGNDEQKLDDLARSTASSLGSVGQIDELVSTVAGMLATLKQHPNQETYAALVDALNEVVQTWEVTNQAFKEVWQLYNEQGDLKEASEGLLEIGDFQLRRIVQQGRGHCHKIGYIYDQQLAAWFEEALADEEQKTMESIFNSLGKSYLDIFIYMEYFAEETETAANRVLDLVENDQPDEARQVAGALRQTIRPLRTNINRSLVGLQQVQAEFSSLALPSRPVHAAAPAFWNGWLAKDFHDCLLSAYDYPTTRQMLRFELNKRLEDLVPAGGFRDVAFELIEVAEREGWIIELVQAAHRANQTNHELADFARKVHHLSTASI